ncbi:MAG: dTDP-4-dehydrorhamnose 3,5-epimerase family protein [Bacteroidia bacterium]|nr:dTDP-4-dehydrorhamnose 3,5-epimerase family protein [Bacteroidia bacterium]
MFELKETKLKDCFEILFKKLEDRRGSFTKTFHIDAFKKLGIDMDIKEEYFTASQKNVFRGLHFQNPPKAIAKMVFCVSGQVTDYVVDIRANSPTYGQWVAFELDGNKPSMVFVPEGFAHGFYVKSENALMQYKVSDVFDAACDDGISYTSFSFANQIQQPIMSDRDLGFVKFEDYKSPFTL